MKYSSVGKTIFPAHFSQGRDGGGDEVGILFIGFCLVELILEEKELQEG